MEANVDKLPVFSPKKNEDAAGNIKKFLKILHRNALDMFVELLYKKSKKTRTGLKHREWSALLSEQFMKTIKVEFEE